MKRYTLLFSFAICSCLFLLIACKPNQNKVNRAFYFWKSTFELSQNEKNIIHEHHINTLYIKYFDVVWNNQLNNPIPVAKIKFNQAIPNGLEIIPVVYITNSALLNCSIDSISNLAQAISTLIESYKPIVKIKIKEIQLDCDWTLSTKEKYFSLINSIKKHYHKGFILSATIRLHQIKYASTTGVPPVQKGMLMYYNMGNLQSQKINSIFNEFDAEKYAPFIKQYPLPLDAVLPVFSWVKVFRNHQLIKILNQTSLQKLENSGAFKRIDNNCIKALETSQYNQFYYFTNDVFVEEQLHPKLSTKAAEHLHQYFNSKNFTIALFHLHQPHLNEFTTQDFENIYTTFN